MKNNTIKTLVITLLIAISLSGCGSTNSNNLVQTEYTSQSDAISGFSESESESGSGIYADRTYNSNAVQSKDYIEDAITDESDIPKESNENTSEITLSQEKLVYTCNLSIETTTYNDTLQKIEELISDYDGIIQSKYENDNASNWYYDDYYKRNGTLNCNLMLRIPSSKYSEFTKSIGDIGGKIRSKDETIDNISQQYFDTEIKIASLEKQESKLLELMDKATTIEELIQIEARLSEIDAELMKYKTEMKYMDLDVAYSYINIELKEVLEYTEDNTGRKTNTFLDRLLNTLEDTIKYLGQNMEGLLFTVILISPYIILIVITIIVYNKFFKKKVKALKEKRDKKRQAERKADGALSMKDMNKIIIELNEKIKSKEDSDNK